MSAAYLHGVETVEVQKGARSIQTVKTAIIGLVGTAPIFELAAAYQSINKPVLCLGDRDAVQNFGTAREGYTIPQALDAIFSKGAGTVVVINVFDPSTHKTDVAAPGEAHTFPNSDTDLSIDLGHEGLSGVVVKNSDGTVTYQLTTDYTVDAVNGTITRVTTGAIAKNGAVKVTYSYADPSAVEASDIIGTVDESGNRTGLKALRDTFSLYGFNPKIIIAPGFSSADSVVVEMEAIAEKLRAVALIDAPASTTFSEAIEGRGPEGTINFEYAGGRLILLYPHVKVYDPVTDSIVLEPYSQHYAGLMADNDIQRGYHWSPSSKKISGIVGMELPLTAGINDSSSEVNALNAAGIVTIFNSFGTGYLAFGNRTAAYPTDTHPRTFIPVLRTADVIHESIEYAMLQFIDWPIDQAFIDSVIESVNAFLRTLIGRKAIHDGSCTYDPNDNPVTELAAGHIVFGYDFMPPPPAERITFKSFIDINMLKSLSGGNA